MHSTRNKNTHPRRRYAQHPSITELIATMRATAKETEALYALREAAQEAVKQGDLAIIARALETLEGWRQTRRAS